MGGFGENLRREREARGVTLDDISTATKISVRLLQAIENEEFDRLPGGVFNVNFVRQYARHLGLDDQEVVNEFRRLTTPVEPEIPQQRPSITSAEWAHSRESDYDWDRQRQSQIWALATFVIVVIGVASGLYLWWDSRRAAGPGGTVASAPIAGPTIPATPTPEPTRLPTPQAVQASPVAAKLADNTPQPGPSPERSVAPSAAPASPGAEAPIRVEIQATGVVWVAASADGQVRFQTTLQPEQRREVTAQSVVRLRVGDAAAIALTLNGQTQPPVGPKGQVRTVILTPQGMRVLAPPPKDEPQPTTPPPQPSANQNP